MELYLIQHAQAHTKEEDHGRSLNTEGRKTIDNVSAHLKRLGLRTHIIYHSTKLRSRQTAQEYAKVIPSWRGCVERQGLCPNDDIGPVMEELSSSRKAVAIVGHLPFLSRLASALLLGDPERDVIKFQHAGVVKLERNDETGRWQVAWTLFPELLAPASLLDEDDEEGDRPLFRRP
ncbi:MAG: phosphohistidine phosphatase SixA [Candidatus Undinarchaeales archaeon]|jgi:phosphohistidine phosphatase|nr:phosphohistidine phosphatase SixA [Candidatus Undinarchaeales archaeon]MDP7491501.1 phosphohistidine phosphatase SixA [Candidatus Undinarchaeales archaeon]